MVNLDNSQIFQDRSVLGKLYQERMYKEPSTSEATELIRKLIQTMKTSVRASGRVLETSGKKPAEFPVGDRDWRLLEILEELQEWLVEDAVDLYWDWYCMNQICGEIWKKIETVFSQNAESSGHGQQTAMSITGAILKAGADVERMLDENRIVQQYVQDENPDRCPELTVVRNIIQDTIQTLATPPNRPVGWIGDRCIRRLLHVSPEAIRPLGRPRGLDAQNLYFN